MTTNLPFLTHLYTWLTFSFKVFMSHSLLPYFQGKLQQEVIIIIIRLHKDRWIREKFELPQSGPRTVTHIQNLLTK